MGLLIEETLLVFPMSSIPLKKAVPLRNVIK
jgi:hypothetical protein